jgi:hypothetical protein
MRLARHALAAAPIGRAKPHPSSAWGDGDEDIAGSPGQENGPMAATEIQIARDATPPIAFLIQQAASNSPVSLDDFWK